MSLDIKALLCVLTQAKIQIMWWRVIGHVTGTSSFTGHARTGLGETADLIAQRLARLDAQIERDFRVHVFLVQPPTLNNAVTPEAAWAFYASFYGALLETFLCQKSQT